MSQAPASPITNSLAASCLRIAEHFAAIAMELENFETLAGSSLDSLASLDAHEQSHVDGAPIFGLRRSKMQAARSTKVDQKFLSLAAVADRLGIDKRTLQRIRSNPAEHFPKPSRFGGSLRWNAAEIEAWTERQKERA